MKRYVVASLALLALLGAGCGAMSDAGRNQPFVAPPKTPPPEPPPNVPPPTPVQPGGAAN